MTDRQRALHWGGGTLFFRPHGTVSTVDPQVHETVSVSVQG